MISIQEWIHRFKLMIAGAFTTTDQDDEKGFSYRTQVQRFNASSTSMVYYPYGYYASAPSGSQAYVFSLEAKQENKMSLLYDGNTRFKGLKPGEAMMGNQIKQTFIKFTNDGGISIFASADVNISCVNMKADCSGDAEIDCENATLTANKDINASCENATLTANDKADINCKSSTVTVDGGNGTMKIDGTLEVTKDLSVGGDIETTGASGNGDATLAGDLSASGNVSDGQGSLDNNRTKYNSHVHIGNLGVDTSTPTPTQP